MRIPRVTFNPVPAELLFANNALFLHTCIECAVNYAPSVLQHAPLCVCVRVRVRNEVREVRVVALSRLY